MNEIETKILEVNKEEIATALAALGAEKILDTKFTVDWFRPKGTKDGEDPWFLRIRSDASGRSELTWKSKPDFIGITKQVKEISFPVAQPELIRDFLESIGMEEYGHQEKFRTSWKYQDWEFDLDQYPRMPAYLEIEGKSEEHLKQAIALLKLEKHRALPDGERILIEREYNLDWHNMVFE